jgi:multiple sugar transport system permease protein
MTFVQTPVARITADTERPRKDRPRGRGRLLYVLPAAIFLGILSFYPMFQLVRMSLSSVTSANLSLSWDFVGLSNFANGIQQGDLGRALLNTFVFVLIVSVLGLVGGLGAAIVLRHGGRISGLLLGVMVFVWALPPVVNGSVWKFLLGDDGLINGITKASGMSQTAFPFLYDEHFALMSVALVNSWAIIPFNALVFRAAVLGIPAETFEAAQLDGARPWQEIRYLLLPAVRPTSLVLAVLTIVYAFRSFDFIYVMTYGGPGISTNTLPFLGYLQAFVRFDYGLGSATAVLTVAMVLVLAVVYARSVRKEEQDR